MSAADQGKIDPATVANLYALHGEELGRFLVAILRDTQLAADALQTTFAKLVEHGHKTQEASRKGWLFRVAYHEAMLLRRRQAVDDNARRHTAWSREVVSESADSRLAREETVQRVRQALDSLPPDQRQVVRMRIYEDKTFAVIAEELGIPLGTALGRMRTAMAKLRAKLEDQQ